VAYSDLGSGKRLSPLAKDLLASDCCAHAQMVPVPTLSGMRDSTGRACGGSALMSVMPTMEAHKGRLDLCQSLEPLEAEALRMEWSSFTWCAARLRGSVGRLELDAAQEEE
jgi:hypothetical protein